MKRIFYWIVFGALSWNVMLWGSVERSEVQREEQLEKQLLDMLNWERERNGLHALQQNQALTWIACNHSEKMAQEKELSHFFPEWKTPEMLLVEKGFFFSVHAENIAQSKIGVAAVIHESFLKSILHRINIMDPRMTHIGIGVIKKDNDYWVTEEFSSILTPESDELVMSRLEKDIRNWYKGKYHQSIATFPEARKMAKVMAQQYLIDNPIRLDLQKWGKVRVINIIYYDIGTILKEIEREVPMPRYRSFTIGVTRGRNARFPGGAYAVSVLLFFKKKFTYSFVSTLVDLFSSE